MAARGYPHFVRLEREADNPHDKNAVKVCDAPTGHHVGYLSRRLAREFRDVVDKRGDVVYRAKLIGGTPDKPTIGVMFDGAEIVDDPDRHRGKGCLPGCLVMVAGIVLLMSLTLML